MCSYPTHLKEGYKSYKLNTPLSPPVKYFLQTVPGQYFFCGYLCFFCVVFITLSRLSIAALWLPAGKGLTSWLLLVVLSCSCYFPMWYPGSGVVLDFIDS